MTFNIQETIQFLISYESILILSVIIGSIFNLIMNKDNPNIILIGNLVMITCYFILTKKKDKMVILLALLHYSIWGFIIESFIINKTNVLSYRQPEKSLNVPLWLLTSYSVFILGGLYTYDLVKILVK